MTDTQPPAGEARRNTSSSRRRGLAIIVVAALGLLIGRAFTERSVTVEVVYRFGAGAAAVRSLSAVYYPGPGVEAGKDLGSLQWRFDERGAPPEKVHTTHLPPGDHAVEITVVSRGGTEQRVHGRVDVPALASARSIIELQ